MSKELEELRTKVEAIETRASEMQKEAEERKKARELEEQRAKSFYGDRKNTMKNEYRADWAEVKNALLEKRALSIQANVLGDNVGTDTGRVSQISEVWDLIKQREPLMDKISVFEGSNWETQIPVLESRPAVPTKVSEGWDGNSPDATKNTDIAVKKITPDTYVSVLPITYEAARMSFANLEEKIPGYLAESYRTAMCNLVFTEIFKTANVAAANVIETASASAVGLKDLLDLALAVKDTDIAEPYMILNQEIYSAIAAAQGGVYDFVKESLIRDKKVEDVPVIITGKAPKFSTASEGDIVVWCGDLKNFAMGIAQQIEITPIKKLGSSNTFYQAIAAFNGTVVNPKNVFALGKAGV